MNKSVIGIVGPAGSGKSSVAGYMRDAYGAKLYAFARPLKEMCRAAFDLSEAQVWGTQAEKEAIDPRYGVSARWILQRVGTDGLGDQPLVGEASTERAGLAFVGDPVTDARLVDAAVAAGFGAFSKGEILDGYRQGFRTALGPNVWVRILMNQIVREAPELAVVEDVRFVNEATQIRTWEYPAPRRARGWVWRLWPVGQSTSTDAGTHASETEWARIPTHVVTQEFQPEERGLDRLFAMVRDAASSCGIRPTGAL